jgi:cytochrome c551/c552
MSRSIDWAGACAVVTAFVLSANAETQFPGVGRPATAAEIKAWDIDVRPDFKGLPPGAGSVAQGQKVWDEKCASCHGTFGESNEVFTPLVGGTTAEDVKAGRVKALVTGDVARTTLMKVATLSTLWDYIHRAMPWNAPKSLSVDEVYAVLAYLLNLGDILPADFVLSDRNIAEAQQRLPNRNGMTQAHGLWDIKGKPDVANAACMKNCPVEAGVTSELPDHAQGSHGNLGEQQRMVGAMRKPAADGDGPPALARRNACLSCHAVDKKLVGPAFRDVAAKYKGQAGMEAKLVEKLQRGGSGAWGQVAMPANPGLAEKDARVLVQWVLSGGL